MYHHWWRWRVCCVRERRAGREWRKVNMEDVAGPCEGILGCLAEAVGASEPALRLLISILLGYPLAFLHRYTLYGKSPALQHIFFATCGLSLGYFNYGVDIIHSMICVSTIYLTLVTVGGTVFSVIFSFTFNMIYLLVGYYYTGTENYDITWSMPHCVLTLRLIGLTYDVYDGCKDPASLSESQQKTALKKVPSILEIAGHTYFYGGFMVGPQFPMKRYQDFIRGVFTQNTIEKLPACVAPGLIRGGSGLFYLLIFQVASRFLSDAFLISNTFQQLPYYQRLLVLGLWGKITLYKYISCWLLSEGTCTLTGLTYNGADENGNHLWDGCANFKVRKFEGSTQFSTQIQSFNINTNLWVAAYVFKRLKFMGNKLLSQAMALLFLALWHGLHSGYYMCFALEFVVMKFERDLSIVIERIPIVYSFLNAPIVKPIKWVFLKVYIVIFMGYCLVPFVFLSFSRWWQVYRSVYFIGHILYFGWLLASPFIFILTKKFTKKVQKKE